MSFDVEFFRLPDGIELDEVNRFLLSEEYEQFCRELEAREEEDEDADLPPLPDKYVDTSVSREELERLIGRAFLRLTVPEDNRSEELKKYIESDANVEVPEEWEEVLEEFFEWSGAPGTLPFCFTLGDDIKEILTTMAQILEELQSHRIVLYDPQLDKVIDGTNAHEQLMASADEAWSMYAEVVQALLSGDLVLEDDDEDEED